MATPGENTALKRQESPRLTTQSEGASPTNEPNVDFGSFAMYIAELQNITVKFPEIFQALEDMSKETNDINKLNIFLSRASRAPLIKPKNEHPTKTLDGDMECKRSSISHVGAARFCK
ncbi:hypothetical protein TNCV_1851821 [Trichonephila clavipes]|nr:hypothetical protein TNCV_1851821 [Trichonephila clavipes]